MNCTDCILDLTDACPRGAGRAVDDEVCNGFLSERNQVIDELKSNCIKHIQRQRPLTLEEIIHIIQFEADQMKHTNKNL